MITKETPVQEVIQTLELTTAILMKYNVSIHSEKTIEEEVNSQHLEQLLKELNLMITMNSQAA